MKFSIHQQHGLFIKSTEAYVWKSGHQRVLNDYRGPGFFAVTCLVIWLLPHPLTSPPSVSSTGGRLRKRDNLLPGEGVRGGGGAKSYDGEKVWPSINHSILSAAHPPMHTAPFMVNFAYIG